MGRPSCVDSATELSSETTSNLVKTSQVGRAEARENNVGFLGEVGPGKTDRASCRMPGAVMEDTWARLKRGTPTITAKFQYGQWRQITQEELDE